MHSSDFNALNVPAFLIKLWKLVEDSSCDDLITWNDNGLSFIIRDQAKFAGELLPLYFKHSNMASFVRQLNMYGFRKVINYEKSGLKTDNNEMEFQHSYFLRDQIELLELIKRKMPNARVAVEPRVNSNPKDMLTDLTSIKDKQESMDKLLSKMKHENELLWKELTNMRQKHKKQEQVIQNVISFLVQVIRNQPVSLQRKVPQMLHDSPNYKKNSHCNALELCMKDSDCIILPDKNHPVIHEVEDFEVEEPSSVESNNPSSLASPAPVSSQKTSTPNIISLTPARESEILNHGNRSGLESTIVNNSNENSESMQSLSVFKPFQTRISTDLDDDYDDDSYLNIPLEYITADDASHFLPSSVNKNVIAVPGKSILKSVKLAPAKKKKDEFIQIHDNEDINNVATLSNCGKSNNDAALVSKIDGISNVLSIPEGTDISSIISIPEGSNINSIISGINVQDENDCKRSLSESIQQTENVEDSNMIPYIYDATQCHDLQVDFSPVKKPLNLTISKPDLVDPLLSDCLNTPIVKLSDDEPPDFTINDKRKSLLSITNNEHDYPASTDSSNLIKTSDAKNILSNHLQIVEEELNKLQDNIATSSWEVDADKLLGLFTSDGMVNNDSFVDQLGDTISIKKEPVDDLEDELNQLTPMLGVDFDVLRSPFLEGLNPELMDSDQVTNILTKTNPNLLEKVLGDTNKSEEIQQKSDYSIKGEACSPGKRQKNSKDVKIKRCKLK